MEESCETVLVAWVRIPESSGRSPPKMSAWATPGKKRAAAAIAAFEYLRIGESFRGLRGAGGCALREIGALGVAGRELSQELQPVHGRVLLRGPLEEPLVIAVGGENPVRERI